MTYDDRRAAFVLQQCCKCLFWFFTAHPEPFVCRECERKQP